MSEAFRRMASTSVFQKKIYSFRSPSNRMSSYMPPSESGSSSGPSSYNDYSGSYSNGGDCCDAVVDPLTYISLLVFIALATYFITIVIANPATMLMMPAKRRRREINGLDGIFANYLDSIFDKGKNIKISL